MKTARVTVRFPLELRRRLKKAAKSRGTKESDFIRRAVERQLQEEDSRLTAYDLAVRSGFIGAGGPGSPPDLSTNPKYFEGFGE